MRLINNFVVLILLISCIIITCCVQEQPTTQSITKIPSDTQKSAILKPTEDNQKSISCDSIICPSPKVCCDGKCLEPCREGYYYSESCRCIPPNTIECGNKYCPSGTVCCQGNCLESCKYGFIRDKKCLCSPPSKEPNVICDIVNEIHGDRAFQLPSCGKYEFLYESNKPAEFYIQYLDKYYTVVDDMTYDECGYYLGLTWGICDGTAQDQPDACHCSDMYLIVKADSTYHLKIKRVD